VERAHRARKLTDLEKELHGERSEAGAQDGTPRHAEPEGMTAEGAASVDRRAEIIHEPATRHAITCTAPRGTMSTCAVRDVAGESFAPPP
jgi:hypothetical protein